MENEAFNRPYLTLHCLILAFKCLYFSKPHPLNGASSTALVSEAKAVFFGDLEMLDKFIFYSILAFICIICVFFAGIKAPFLDYEDED